MSRYRLGDITLKSYNSWENVPREPFKELVKKGVQAALGYTLGPVGTFIFEVVYYAATTAITYSALSALEGKYDFSIEQSQGRLINSRTPTGSQQYVYGKVRKGGVIVNLETEGSNNKYLHMIIALAGHEVDEIGDIYVNDKIVNISNNLVTDAPWNSKIKIVK